MSEAAADARFEIPLTLLVGAAGFEPATPCAQGRCATRLRYAPTLKMLNLTAVFLGSPVRVLRLPDEIVAELFENFADSSRLPKNPRRLVARWIELLRYSRFICNLV